MHKVLIFLLGWFGFSFSFVGYAQKLPLSKEVYSEWNDFSGIAMNGGGTWVNYGIANTVADTLFLQAIKSSKKHVFPKAKGGLFSPNNDFFTFTRSDSLYLFDLKSEEQRYMADSVLTYHFSKDGKQLVVLSNSGKNKKLTFIQLATLQRKVVTGITDLSFSNDKRYSVSVVSDDKGQKVVLYDLNTNKENVIANFSSTSLISGFKWDDKGQKFAFFLDEATEKPLQLYYYSLNLLKGRKSNLQVLPPSYLPKEYVLNRQSLYLPSEGSRVFFSLESVIPKKQKTCESCVQVWHSDSAGLPPLKKNGRENNNLFWHFWDVNAQQVGSVEDTLYKNAILDRNAQYALLSGNKRTDLDSVKSSSNDLHLKDLKKQEYIALEPISKSFPNTLMFSPKGNFIVYYTEKQWWVYAIQKRLYTCITCSISSNFYNEHYDKPGSIPPAATAWWVSDDSSLFLSDTHDVWQFTSDGTLAKRITRGKEVGKVYRIYDSQLPSPPKVSYYGFQTRVVPKNIKQLLSVKDLATLGTGFAIMDENSHVIPLIERSSALHLIQTSVSFDHFLFVEQNFSLSPRLLFVDGNGKFTEIAQTNKQQAKYEWGKSKLISYQLPGKSKSLKSALFYPESYDARKEYPLLVVVYEKKSGEMMEYIPPSEKSSWGFTLSNYVSDGYFVLYPDIIYGFDNPGADALACVTAAVTEVLKDYSISKERVALMGHSFGGYETAYIMGNTNLFRTAVIGSPMIDLVSAYLTSDGHGKSNMWRFERDQMRITAPFYSDDFLKNSPLRYAFSITSPILTWTGTKDLQLDWLHSVKFHNALWRLGKLSTLLVYPDEGHVLMRDTNQMDLSKRIKDWLDYYLKSKPKGLWMQE